MAVALSQLLGYASIIKTVPDVFGSDEAFAYEHLRAMGFGAREIYEYNGRVAKSHVIRTDPAANTQAWGSSTIQLYVSSGARPPSTGPEASPAAAALPNVYGLEAAAGEQQLTAAGFNWVSFSVCSSKPAGTVRQVILAGRTPEVVLVDQGGLTTAGYGIRKDQALAVKISSGVPCS